MIKIADCRLRIADFILSLAKSFTSFPRSEFRNRKLKEGGYKIIGKI
jgi:hypothetical protein